MKFVINKSKKINLTKEEKKKIPLRELGLAMRYMFKFKWQFLLVVLLLAVVTTLSVITPIYTGKLIATLSENSTFMACLYIAIVLLILSVLGSLLDYPLSRLWSKVALNNIYQVRININDRVMQIRQSCIDKSGTNYFTSRIYSDSEEVSRFPLSIVQFLTQAIGNIGFFTYIMTINVYVALIEVFTLVLLIVLHSIRISNHQKYMRFVRKEYDPIRSMQTESLRGIKDIRGINATSSVVDVINKQHLLNDQHNLYRQNIQQLNRLFINLSSSIAAFAVIALAIYLFTQGQIALAAAIIIFNYHDRVASFASYVVSIKETIANTLVSAQRINELFDDTKFPIETFGNVQLTNCQGVVCFDNVSFSYNSGTEVLNNISFTLQPNTVTAFVGASGSGKSTIVSLLNKLYTLDNGQGQILIDGVNINDLDQHSLRSNIAVISQNPYLFNMTIAENLRLAKPDATQDELIDALTQADIYQYVSSLPNGLDTKLGENGITVSGGQKQRIAIARALLCNSPIIVFDEATSALDNITQSNIQNTIFKLKANHTVIIVAHRLSTIIDSDTIMLLKGGNIVASGTHNNLMHTSPEYQALYKKELIDENSNAKS